MLLGGVTHSSCQNPSFEAASHIRRHTGHRSPVVIAEAVAAEQARHVVKRLLHVGCGAAAAHQLLLDLFDPRREEST